MTTIRLHSQPNLATRLVTGPAEDAFYGRARGPKKPKSPRRPKSPGRGGKKKKPKPRMMCGGGSMYDMNYGGASDDREWEAFFRSSSKVKKDASADVAKAVHGATEDTLYKRIKAKVKHYLGNKAGLKVMLVVCGIICVYFGSPGLLKAFKKLSKRVAEDPNGDEKDMEDSPEFKEFEDEMKEAVPDTSSEMEDAVPSEETLKEVKSSMGWMGAAVLTAMVALLGFGGVSHQARKSRQAAASRGSPPSTAIVPYIAAS